MPAILRVFTISIVLLVACAVSTPIAQAAQTPPQDDAVVRTLEPLMAAEFALQAGRLDEAARWYLQAALAAQDMPLTERATRIALLARDDDSADRLLSLWRRQGGQGVNFLAAEASLALRHGNERQARKYLVQLLDMPGDEGWRQVLGVIVAGARDPAQAATVLETLVRQGRIPGKLQAWLAFGGLAQRLEQPELAERIVAEVVKRFPGEPRVALLRASQLREARKKDQARDVLAGVVEQAGGDSDLRLAIAYEYDALGDLDAAAATLARGPQDEQTYALRASLLARGQDKTALVALYDELRRHADTPDPQRRLLLGQIAEFLDRFDEALGWYQGVPGGPQRWPASLRSANVLYELGRAQEGFAHLHDMQADAGAPDDARRDAYLLEAALHEKARDAVAEKDAFSRGLAAFPDDLEILYARALSWERADDIARAEADLRRILVIDPESVAALNALGYTLADRTDRYQEALELINRARAAQPDNAAIIDSYGWVLYRLGRNEEALGELRQAFALQKDAEIAAHLGEVLWVLGKRDEARKYFEEARQIDPDNRSLQRALEKTVPEKSTP
ncbi:membrane protein [Lysobacter concretionis Ko07 = DSM 16239]|uniref:Membrane protein n=1 Tax=Lysobacter concretionis Ko07 = DSM 16239 TaxID=1122185 RepID=A0A0A0EIK3_9GAMM|nr:MULTISPECIES: tetratricopeptide repeat protein [Lysobacter]KGM50781.1 membrane protein [Lysobacter concretionis Ko07 = DSM 16239]QOD91574.1 tetratricopeptide repeat protein [Lysobacter sp. CW239]